MAEKSLLFYLEKGLACDKIWKIYEHREWNMRLARGLCRESSHIEYEITQHNISKTR